MPQTGNGGGAQGFHRWYKDGLVVHLSDGECIFREIFRTLLGEQGFTDEIKIDQSPEKPFGQVPEMLVHLGTDRRGVFLGSPVQPVALHRMNDAHAAKRCSPGQDSIQACKMIFNIAVFPVPGRLIIEGGRIIAFCLTVHGYPGEMRHTDGDAESSLPVTCKLMTA